MNKSKFLKDTGYKEKTVDKWLNEGLINVTTEEKGIFSV